MHFNNRGKSEQQASDSALKATRIAIAIASGPKVAEYWNKCRLALSLSACLFLYLSFSVSYCAWSVKGSFPFLEQKEMRCVIDENGGTNLYKFLFFFFREREYLRRFNYILVVTKKRQLYYWKMCLECSLVNFLFRSFRIIEFNWKSVRVLLILDRDSVDGKRIRMKGITFYILKSIIKLIKIDKWIWIIINQKLW